MWQLRALQVGLHAAGTFPAYWHMDVLSVVGIFCCWYSYAHEWRNALAGTHIFASLKREVTITLPYKYIGITNRHSVVYWLWNVYLTLCHYAYHSKKKYLWLSFNPTPLFWSQKQKSLRPGARLSLYMAEFLVLLSLGCVWIWILDNPPTPQKRFCVLVLRIRSPFPQNTTYLPQENVGLIVPNRWKSS